MLMITLDDLKKVLADSREIAVETEVLRKGYLDWLFQASSHKPMKVVTGFRRSGKTFLLKQTARFLEQEKNIPYWNIFFLNFEHDLLVGVNDAGVLRQVFEMYLQNVADLKRPIFLFLDEIQKVSGWEHFVRTLYESGKYNIFLSGSNSQLLSGEFTTSLAGRFVELTVFPFNFKEFLAFHKIVLEDDEDYYKHRNVINNYYSQYLNRGGIPEQFGLSDDLAKNYFEGLLQKVILDDIATRYKIDMVPILRPIFQFMAGNVTSSLSLRKMSNILKEQGINISVPTLDSYLYYFETAFSILPLKRFDYKLYSVFEKTNKFYFVDNLLLDFDYVSSEKKLENLVFISLIRKYGRDKVFFGRDKNGYEVDFVVKKDSNNFCIFQVCLQLNSENEQREIGNAKLAKKYLKGEAKVIVERDVRKDKSGKGVVNIIDFLMETENSLAAR